VVNHRDQLLSKLWSNAALRLGRVDMGTWQVLEKEPKKELSVCIETPTHVDIYSETTLPWRVPDKLDEHSLSCHRSLVTTQRWTNLRGTLAASAR
jgi:hypothetical protein